MFVGGLQNTCLGKPFCCGKLRGGIPETPLTTAWWVTSTRVAPPLLQVWAHQEPSIDIQSECQLDVITIPLGVWFFEEANVSNVNNWLKHLLGSREKLMFGCFQLSTTEKIYLFYEGFKRWEPSNYPNLCKNCHVIQRIVHHKQDHVQKYPRSPIASAKRKTQTLFEMGHLDDGFHSGCFLWWQLQSQAFQNFKSNLIPKTNCTITSNSEWVCELLYASWIPSSRFDWCICDRRL